jgi:hypothetical protein
MDGCGLAHAFVAIASKSKQKRGTLGFQNINHLMDADNLL